MHESEKNCNFVGKYLHLHAIMKRIAFILFFLLTFACLMAEEITIAQLTFEITSDSTAAVLEADESITSVDIPSTITHKGTSYKVTKIGGIAFGHCYNLSSVTIPESVTIIEDWAFANCYSLTAITIPEGVKSIGGEAFVWCENLVSVVLPNSLTDISWGVFRGCTKLNSINIPSNIWHIGGWTFQETGLYDNPSNWENGALYIDNCLIAVDTNLVGYYVVKDNTRLIAGEAFKDCSSVTSVIIPNNVKSIGYYAFNGCKKLSKLNYIGTKEQWNNITKDNYWDLGITAMLTYNAHNLLDDIQKAE